MVYSTKTVNVDVEVEIDLDDFEDDELLDELYSRGVDVEDENFELVKGFLNTIWEKKRAGQDYSQDLDDLIYCGIGKIL